jgi:hypothetical protein
MCRERLTNLFDSLQTSQGITFKKTSESMILMRNDVALYERTKREEKIFYKDLSIDQSLWRSAQPIICVGEKCQPFNGLDETMRTRVLEIMARCRSLMLDHTIEIILE